MGTLISTLLVLLPFIKPLITKAFPWLFKKLVAWFGKKGIKGGVLGGVIAIIVKIFGVIARFPAWLKGLLKNGGRLSWLSALLLTLGNIFKTPVLLFIALTTSYLFPGILERIFLIVGTLTMKFLLVFVKAGKAAITNLPASEGGAEVIDEFKNNLLDSIDVLPPCMVDVLGYMHAFEMIGMIVSTALFCGVVNLVKTVYSGFTITGNRHGLG